MGPFGITYDMNPEIFRIPKFWWNSGIPWKCLCVPSSQRVVYTLVSRGHILVYVRTNGLARHELVSDST